MVKTTISHKRKIAELNRADYLVVEGLVEPIGDKISRKISLKMADLRVEKW
jgi:hypothetical protein